MKQEYYEWRDACIARMEAILTSADAESRNLNDAETAEYERLNHSVDTTNAMIEKHAKVENMQAESRRAVRSVPFPNVNFNKADNPDEFRSFGEFIHSVRFNPADRRLEYREQTMGVGAEGGFNVPKQFKDTLLAVDAQAPVIRSRATVIPAGDPPDAEITMPALDQGAAENIFGGVEVTWIGEGQTKNETDAKFKEVKLTPNEVAAYITVTDKLLRNWQAAGPTLSGLLRNAILASEDYQFLRGNGVSKPQGVIGSACEIAYNRAVASQIAFADIVGMLARLRSDTGAVWIASRTTIPQLANVRDTGNNNLFIMNATLGVPASLMGIPLIFNERSPALGTKGDLVLADLSYYLIKDGSGPFVSASEHVYFRNNKTVIKAFWNVDGKPWLSEVIPLEGDATKTVSPIVVLDVP